jgi:hypothetical protein
MTPKQEQRIAAVRERLSRLSPPTYPPIPTLDDVLKYAPEGDFKWDAECADDWHVYCCGEKDCERQWHLVAYAENIGRSEGRVYYELTSCDEDGNWDPVSMWEEGQDADGFETFEEFYRDSIASLPFDYFTGWIEYWLACAESGEDPCDQAFRHLDKDTDAWVEFCIDAAEKNLGLLVSE